MDGSKYESTKSLPRFDGSFLFPFLAVSNGLVYLVLPRLYVVTLSRPLIVQVGLHLVLVLVYLFLYALCRWSCDSGQTLKLLFIINCRPFLQVARLHVRVNVRADVIWCFLLMQLFNRCLVMLFGRVVNFDDSFDFWNFTFHLVYSSVGLGNRRMCSSWRFFKPCQHFSLVIVRICLLLFQHH